jgi:2'-5' RNA ligase
VVVSVPEAERLVGDLRRRHTSDAPLGMPAHVTLLFPFVPSERLGDVERRIAEVVADASAFDVVFLRTARFERVLYLAPEPPDPFAALTEAIVAEWPEHAPYEGAHETVVPHLTVAWSEDTALLDALAAELEPRLPVETRVREVSLFVEDEDHRWHERRRLPLAERA